MTIHKLLIYLWFEMATRHKHGGAGGNCLAAALYVIWINTLIDFADGVCRISASGDARDSSSS